MLEGAGASHPQTPASPLGEEGVPGCAPVGRGAGGAGTGPPLQTLTLFSQVRRQFPWKQPGAETGNQNPETRSLQPPIRLPGFPLPAAAPRCQLGAGHGAPTLLPAVRGAGRAHLGTPRGWGAPAAHSTRGCARHMGMRTAHGDGHGVWPGGTAGRGELQAGDSAGSTMHRQVQTTSAHICASRWCTGVGVWCLCACAWTPV